MIFCRWKSMLIDAVASKISTNSGICASRARGWFGKSMNAQMLGAYYTKGVESGALYLSSCALQR